MAKIVTIKSVENLYEKWMTVKTTDGQIISGKGGYLRELLDIADHLFGEYPEVKGLKIKIVSETDALTTAIFFRGLWIKSKIMQEMWRNK